MSRQSPRRLVTGALLCLACGCHSFQTPRTVPPAPGSIVRLEFSAPRSLLLLVEGADSARAYQVLQVDGRLVAAASDSLTLLPRAARAANRAPLPLRGGPLRIATADAGMKVRRPSWKRTALAAGLPAVTVAILLNTLPMGMTSPIFHQIAISGARRPLESADP